MQTMAHVVKYTLIKPSPDIESFINDPDFRAARQSLFIDSGRLSEERIQVSDTELTIIRTFRDALSAAIYKEFCETFNGGRNRERLQSHIAKNNITVKKERIN
jgi:hypothetical protein